MDKDALFHLLALKHFPKIGDIKIKRLIAYCGGVKNVFSATKSDLLQIPSLGKQQVITLTDKTTRKAAFEFAEQEIRFIEQENIATLPYFHPDYPKRLKQCEDSPVLLFYKGKTHWNDQKIIGIVGTRNMTDYGAAFLDDFMKDIAPLQPVIVSGLAYGVDIKAHRLAVKHNLPTIACVAHGLHTIYPAMHRKYINEILESGAVVTEFPSGTKADRENFPKRNRIIAGLSDCVIVVESAKKGGSLITADLAFGYNRDVFAVPGNVTAKYSEGCNWLIKTQKAHLLQSAKDICYIMNWQLNEPEKPESKQQQLFVELNTDEQKIINFITSQTDKKAPIDEISINTKFPISKTATLLLSLEFKGVIKSLPGKIYKII